MRILLDENLPLDLRHFLPGHEVATVDFMGWKGVTNGELLARAAAAGFDALVTKDAGIQHEQNLTALPLAILAIKARSNALDDLRPLIPSVLNALASLKPKTLVTVGLDSD